MENIESADGTAAPLVLPRLLLPVIIVMNAGLWATLAAAGFPRIYWDDAIIVAPSLGLVEFGELRNIYLNKDFYAAHTYLFYPPTFSWVLAGWIAVLGASSATFSAFWVACATIGSASLGVALYRLVGARWTFAAAPVLLLGCIAYMGMRYETLGFATFFAGVALGTSPSGRLRLAGYFLLFVTPTIAVTFLGSCTVAVLAIFFNRVARDPGRELAAAAAGLAGAVAMLLLGTGGALIELANTMYAYRDVRIGLGGRQVAIMETILLGSFLLAAVTAAIRILILGENVRSPAAQLPLLLLAALPLTLLSHARPSIQVAANIAIVFVFALACTDAVRRWIADRDHVRPGVSAVVSFPWAPIGFCLLLLLLNIHHAVTFAPHPMPDALKARARAIAAAAPLSATLVADPPVIAALGFPVDGRLEDVLVRRRWPDIAPKPRDVPAGEYWIVQRSSLEFFLDPSSVRPPTIEVAFIAAGMPRAAREELCVLDRNRSFLLAAHGLRALPLLCSS